jgi:hypothetical protein
MLLLLSLLLYDDCTASRTITFNQSSQIVKSQLGFHFANDIVCLDMVIPHVAVSFLTVSNSTITIYTNTSIAQPKASPAAGRLSLVDFGNETGTIVVRSLSATELTYSAIAYPSICGSRITSNRQSDALQIGGDEQPDGRVGPESALCYFPAVHGGINFTVDVDLTSGQSQVDVWEANSLRNHFTGKATTTFGSERSPFFVVENRDGADYLKTSAAIKFAGSGPSNSARGRWDGGPMLLFYGEAPPANEPLPRGAFFAMAAVLYLCLAIAGVAYLVLKAFQAAQQARPVVRGTELPPPASRLVDHGPDDGNPEFPPDDL